MFDSISLSRQIIWFPSIDKESEKNYVLEFGSLGRSSNSTGKKKKKLP